MSRTPSKLVPEVPGWWVKLVSTVVEQLPRPGEGEGMIDQTTTEGWTDNKEVLKKTLVTGLLPPKPAPVAGSVPVEKFGLLADLGIVTVPADYNHATCLDMFKTRHRQGFYGYDDDITDKHFSNASVKLTPGRKLRVRVFRQVVPGTTTSEERMAFLATQKAVHTGAQGASLVWEQKRDQIPKGFWYASFDEKEALWEDAAGYHRVPGVDVRAGGAFPFSLGYFEGVWRDDYAFFGFCDE